jgi:ABC-type bacteriocin/lantibiotic exporter with double-glycine peptidase domain
MGSVGSGKSTLLAAIANELKPLFGTVNLRSNSMAYVPQQAWIQNMSLRDNILFESDFNADFYEKTLDACALRDDIQLLPGGDLTEIGEKGINLSGGQKARVSLARAVYQQADFYILDDPLSAVDSHVGHHLFNNVIANGGLLDGKTRIVAINSKTFLQHFDIIICLKGEKISYCGPYSGLYNESSASLSSQVLPDESEETKSREKTVKGPLLNYFI